MNGRIYDSAINRFLQADPIVQAPGFVLSYNRYSYVWNNPINMMDPTGYTAEGLDDFGFGDGEDPFDSSTWNNGSCGACGGSSSPKDDTLRGSDNLLARAANAIGNFFRDWNDRNQDWAYKRAISNTVAGRDWWFGISQQYIRGAAQRLKPTEAEYKLIDEGKLAEMWQGRCAAGDSIGCVGFATWGNPADVIAMHGKVDGAYWVGIGASVRFNALNGLLEGNPELLLNPDALYAAVLSFGKAIATAHLDATSADLSGRHYSLSAPEITNYHHAVFDQFNVSRRWYGGSYITGRHEPLLEPFYCRPSCDSN